MTTSSLQLPLPLLPAYSIRVSNRARRLHLRVVPPDRVEVVVPKGMALKHVPAFVAEHQDWLRDTLARLGRDTPAAVLPSEITLAATGETWRVEYLAGHHGRISAQKKREDINLIQVAAATDARRYALLQQWLTQRAKAVLPPWLSQVSREIGLSYTEVSIRAQQTRWGSCSSRKHISLNRALLFMPPDVVRYLLIHELCHTVHLNHSQRYWKLVETFAPQRRRHEAVLDKGLTAIPRWALVD